MTSRGKAETSFARPHVWFVHSRFAAAKVTTFIVSDFSVVWDFDCRRTCITPQLFSYGNDSNKVILDRTGRMRESDVQAHPWPRRENGTTRPLAFLLVAVFTDVNCLGIYNLLHFYNLYSARNGREQSTPPVTECFFVKAELQKFGEVRSHPPHPPWLRHWVSEMSTQLSEVTQPWLHDISHTTPGTLTSGWL